MIFAINILLFFFSVHFYYTGILNLSIRNITPLLVLPLLTSFAIFHHPLSSSFVGLLCGIFMDSCMIGSYCFNAIILLLAGAGVSLMASNLFNKNIKATIVISLIICSVYFILQWLFFHSGNVTFKDSLMYLFNYALPTAVYSAIFVIPFYYLYKHFNKILSE